MSARNPFSRYFSWLHGRWPSGRVEKGPVVGDGGETNLPGVRVVGDLTGVPLLKFSAHTGAAAVAAILAEDDFRRRDTGDPEILDLAIIGAGVSGVSAAIEAKKAGLRHAVFESAEAFSTIRNFPRQKPIYTYPPAMIPLGELRFQAAVKEGLLAELEDQRAAHGVVPIAAAIERIARKGGLLVLHRRDGQKIRAHRVIVAIGKTGNFRRLAVPGEDLPKVTNRLIDARSSAGRRVMVVGGGDSALEAAVALAEAGATVDLSYRGSEFSRPRPGNVARIRALAASGSVRLHLGTRVTAITKDSVSLVSSGTAPAAIPNDEVFVLIGREPPLEFFRKSGIRVSGDWSWRGVAGLFGFFGLMLFLYHLKGYVSFLGVPGTNLWQLFQSREWFPFNIPLVGGEKGIVRTTLATAGSDPGFLFAFAYTALILIFGWRRIRRRRTPYVTRQTVTLAAIQVIPLFLLPYVVLPWMGANGAFSGGGIGEWFGTTFLSNGPGTDPDQYWRAFGFILAWPLFVYNVFTDAPLWGWLAVSLVQTFVLIPWMVRRWGKGAYCGWICSCGAMAETLGDRHREKMPHGPQWNRLNLIGQVILLGAFLLLGLRVAGWVFPGGYLTNDAGQYLNDAGVVVRDAGEAAWAPSAVASFGHGLTAGNPVFSYKYIVDLWLAGAIGYGLYFHFSGRVWCRFACPLAALMHIYSRFGRFRIFAEKEKCISCNACTSVCHQGIDVMGFANKGLPMEDPQCVRCSACVQVCPTAVLSFGRLDRSGKPIRDRLPARQPE